MNIHFYSMSLLMRLSGSGALYFQSKVKAGLFTERGTEKAPKASDPGEHQLPAMKPYAPSAGSVCHHRHSYSSKKDLHSEAIPE
jgi:hypothetical protein